MQLIDDSSERATQGDGSAALRLVRGACVTFLANPLAFAVAALCVWLLVHVCVGLYRARGTGFDWGLSDVVSCAGCILALLFLTCLAVGHIALMFIVGWRGKRS